MERITRKVSLETLRTRYPVCFPSINDGEIQYMDDDRPEWERNAFYGYIPLGISNVIIGDYASYTQEFKDAYTYIDGHGVLQYKVIPCYTLQKWFTEFTRYYETLRGVPCNDQFASMADYYASMYPGSILTFASDEDDSIAEHGGIKMYRWLKDNYFVMLDFRDEYLGSLTRGYIDISTLCSYSEWSGYLDAIRTDYMSLTDVVRLYGKMHEWYGLYGDDNDGSQYDTCCECTEYKSYGGKLMHDFLSRWLTDIKGKIGGINTIVKGLSDDVRMSLVPRIYTNMCLKEKIEDLGEYVSFCKEFEPGRTYLNGEVCIYGDDVKILVGSDTYNRTEFVESEGGSGVNMYSVPQGAPRRNPNAGSVSGNTKVVINGGTIYHDVFGGGNMAAVGKFSVNDPHPETTEGHTRVFVNDGTIGNTNAVALMYGGNVFGGANQGFVEQERVVTVSGGTVEGDVFGGSNIGPSDTTYLSLKTVNLRGGHIKRGVYGCSHAADEGDPNDPDAQTRWTGFVNISGGIIDDEVFAAGNGGSVTGSLCINIGKMAIDSSYEATGNANQFRYVSENGNFELKPDSLIIYGNVYGGSHHYGDETNTPHWDDYDVAGYSVMFIDGEGYDTKNDKATNATLINTADYKPYMNLGRGLYGSGKQCESGTIGRNIVLRHYGHRIDNTGLNDTLMAATRTLTTIQRGDILMLDSTNVNLSGAHDISGLADTVFGVLKVDKNMYMFNGSGIVLGAEDKPVFMDSIRQLKSLCLKESLSSYNQMGAGNNGNWYVIGIKDHDNHLYRIDTVGSNPEVHGVALTTAEENVIIFNDSSVLNVRYHDKKAGDAQSKQYYGELQGFFRMRGNFFHPHDDSISFAYARPKLTQDPEFANDNTADGGFLSYNNSYNYFTDLGTTFTNTKQYPYINVIRFTRGDREEYRMWVDPLRNQMRWYVDGRPNGWGRDNVTKLNDAGRYPDKPKKTLFGRDDNNKGVGIVSEDYTSQDLKYLNYSYFNHDPIYVVGALSTADEAAIVHDSIDAVTGKHLVDYPLVLYRYPGGHKMSNGEWDNGGALEPVWGVTAGSNAGPGANYGAMLDVESSSVQYPNAGNIELQGVVLDGLFGTLSKADSVLHVIHADTMGSNFNYYDPYRVNRPLVVTHSGTTLALSDSTVLKRGFNNNWADTTWYYDSDYSGIYNGDTICHGGALYVNEEATVNLNGLVTITDNLQLRRIDTINNVNEEEELQYVITPSNVYLPTFSTRFYVEDTLHPNAKIGVTSPIRNTAENYKDNTLSPVAEFKHKELVNGISNGLLAAQEAWKQRNVYDDQDWFFVNGHSNESELTKRTSYFDPGDYNSVMSRTLCFGWTWANVVRRQPAGYSVSNNSEAISISSEQGLAWLISVVNGMNEQTASNLADTIVSLVTANDGTIKDIYNMQQYVWVPIGDPSCQPFSGIFDGNGHIITNLSINFLGKGDRKYERRNYGMFGYVKNGTIKRTFLLNSYIRPVGTVDVSEASDAIIYNIGGLVGYLDVGAEVCNSEAAVNIECLEKSKYEVTAGGLVGKMEGGEVHSSMAMPDMKVGYFTDGPVGGLVGNATGGVIYNSFVNAKFTVDSVNKVDKQTIGGLLGKNDGATMMNSYMALQPGCDSLTSLIFGSIVHTVASGSIDSCYVMQDTMSYKLAFDESLDNKRCGKYTPAMGADSLGYMYADNRIHIGSSIDTAMFVKLNKWVDSVNNANENNKYARWARPGLQEINGDLPVLMLSEYDNGTAHQGGFRSLGTYAGGPALQYGGPVRDRVEVDSALARTKAIAANKDYLFIYGDVSSVGVDLDDITQNKVSIYEHASILSAGSLANYDSTYVGITFDNSRRHALSTAGVNGLGMQDLPRDWHMFSTPLSDAPLGFDYQDHNENTYDSNHPNYSDEGHYNNPWKGTSTEFSWLSSYPDNDECVSEVGKRYWMKDFNPDNQKTDGYFPTHRGNLFDDNLTDLFIVGSDECPSITNDKPNNRYPYGMDFFTWTEPQYHWINFKRNGPNHWHSDEPHFHLDYYGDPNNYGKEDYLNKNEDSLIIGKGYMAAISVPTFLQSHGRLNNGSQSIKLTTIGNYCTGWNLVGNPFHGYLDFDKFADYQTVLDSVIQVENEQGVNVVTKHPFYVVYNADGYGVDDNNAPESAFVYYVKGGSNNGAYASRYLHPHQAFFVMAANKGTLNFTDGNLADGNMVVPRSVAASSEFREWRPNYPLVNLFLSSDHGCNDVTVIEFERPEWGGATKLPELRNGNGLFYGYHDGEHYAALFAPEGTERVPLWFEPKEDDIYTMKWNTANGDFTSLYLIDNLRGVQYDMLANNAYTFEGHKMDYYSRFYIVFNVTDVEEHVEHSFAFFDGSQWVVTGEGELDFIDLQGRVLWHGNLSGGQSRLTFPIVAKGMYLLRLVNSSETKVQKIIVE